MNQCGYRREFCVLRFKTNVIHTTEIKKPITAINQTVWMELHLQTSIIITNCSQ